MTTATTPQTGVAESPYRLSFLRVVRSELIKLVTLRSPWWSIGIVAVLSVGMSLLIAFALTGFPGAPAGNAELALQVVLAPTSFTVLLAVIIGSIQVTGEYSTGMMRSTLTAAPGRIGSLLAKATVIAAFVFVSTLAIFLIAAVATAPIVAGAGAGIDVADVGSWLPRFAAGAFMLAVISVIGVAAGYILRNGPGAIAMGVGIVFVLPLLPAFFPASPGWEWIQDVAKYLPTSAGQALMSAGGNGALEPWAAALTLLAWAVVGLGLGGVILRSRDA
ncbi:ABC transporter permease [Microbacterium sp. cx-55]|uniref:ABC transporter permease n=1 Tax=Microbacterium sp. cx-55 TaxID=2875948 RepID=UPI001CBCFD81|nr:ABC transporter permease [Microbacterium sp. cx-55]MBZ4486184.1 ABC transporter permease [Microbacterium sp. cx-55]UGB33947.1 ABC transporter permease [Microbacterium sp. cx-55]